MDRESAIRRLADYLGYQSLDSSTYEELEHAIQTALQRNILQTGTGGVSLAARNISGYRRDILKEQFIASMEPHGWVDRADSIRRFARWLGFRRTGPNIDEAARSVINGLIRDDRVESKGPQIRRI